MAIVIPPTSRSEHRLHAWRFGQLVLLSSDFIMFLVSFSHVGAIYWFI